MLRYRAKAFPHPVLSNFGDDFGSSAELTFEVDVEIDKESQEVLLHYAVDWSSDWLDEYMLDGYAAPFLDIECRATLFRRLEPLTQLRGTLALGGGQVVGSVCVTPVVLASTDNGSYRPEGLSLEFGDRSFRVQRGDFLAIGPTEIFDLEFERTLAKNMVVLRPSDSEDYREVYRLDFEGDKIVINVGADLLVAVQTMRSSKELQPYLWASIYKDCIAGALKYLFEEEDGEETQLVWGRALLRKLDELKKAPNRSEAQWEELVAQMLVADRGLKKVGD